MKKQPYIITAYIPGGHVRPDQFTTETHLQNAAHAAGVADNLQINLYTIPALEIQFTAPPDPLIPEVPAQDAQDAMLRLINAEIRKRWPGQRQPKYKLYRTATP